MDLDPLRFHVSDANATEQYEPFIDWLSDRTITALRLSQDAGASPDTAIRDYVLTAYRAGLSISEVIDFFCISTPSILESAVSDAEAVDRVMQRFDVINPEIARDFYS